MNKPVIIFAIFLLSAGLFGCQNAAPPQSTFKTNFSLDAVIEANQQYLLESARVSSGAEVGVPDQFTQRHETMALQIEPAGVPAFMEAIRSGIEQALIASDARTLGSELSGSEHFSFSYSQDDVSGTIHVWGVPGAEANYTLIVLITEN